MRTAGSPPWTPKTILTLSAGSELHPQPTPAFTDHRQHIVTLSDGRVVDEHAMRDWLAAIDRRNERVTVLRLSETDAFCQSIAQGRR